MSIPYDDFTRAFLDKITEYDFADMSVFEKTSTVDDYMKRAIAAFKKNCKYNLTSTGDDIIREFIVDIPQDDLIEILDIVSEGMLVQWLKPYTYRQENMENMINTKDLTGYSPAELLRSICSSYKSAKRDFTNMMREYSYNNGDLTDLHL